MSAAYVDLVTSLRQGFPQPVSDRVHDAYFVFSFLRALDQLDGMKSVSPLLGKAVTLDYEAAKQSCVDEKPQQLEQVTQMLVEHLSGMFIWGHPRTNQCHSTADHRERHRQPIAVDLQSESG